MIVSDEAAHQDASHQAVTVVETPDARKTDDSRTRRGPGFHGSTDRCISNRGMDSLRVVVIDVFAEQPSQVVFVQDDYVIEQLSANASDDSLSGSVLPWASEAPSASDRPETLDRARTAGEKIASLS